LRNVFRRDEKIACTNNPSGPARSGVTASSRRVSLINADSILGAGQNAFGGKTRNSSTSANSCAITDSGP
jgi:hypothetical protein